jgi:hypothetical protein
MFDEAQASPSTMDVSYLVAKDCSAGPHAIGQEHFGGPGIHVARYWTDDRSLIQFMKTGTGENECGPTATLLGSENRIEIRPDNVTRV